MNYANTIIENWQFIILAVALISIAALAIYTFVNYPSDEKLKKIKEWLLYAVLEAEKEFGKSTGKIKLRYVYDLFIAKFPAISKVLTFESFSLLVDEALKEFEKLLVNNKTLQVKVYGEELTEQERENLKEKIEANKEEN